MRVVGLITEYNPFHNGHLYHLQKSMEVTGSDCSVCVMSGNYTQRGEPAVFDKWIRAECAIANGVDIVIEIPSAFSMASAEFFAYAAIRLLDATGVVDSICFGSESGELKILESIAELLKDESAGFSETVKASLSSGLSYPASLEKAIIGSIPGLPPGFMRSSNNILAIEYLKSLRKLKSGMIPYTIKRIGNEYKDIEISGSGFSSATSIRNSIRNGLEVSSMIPENVLNIHARAISEMKGPVLIDRFDRLLISRIRSMSDDELSQYPFLNEGLASRIRKMSGNHFKLNDLITASATKRYSEARIRRGIFSVLTGVTAERLSRFMSAGGPQYIRILGFSAKGAQLLNSVHDRASLPVILKTANAMKGGLKTDLQVEMLKMESDATDQYVLGFPDSGPASSGQEFTRKIIFPL